MFHLTNTMLSTLSLQCSHVLRLEFRVFYILEFMLIIFDYYDFCQDFLSILVTGGYYMDSKIAIIHEYNEVLIGRKALVPAFFFGQSDREAETTALIIFKYAFDTYLGWTPEQLRENLTYEIIEKLKLKQALKYIQYPPEFDKKKDMFYVVWRLYPHTANITLNEQVLKVYRMVLDGGEN